MLPTQDHKTIRTWAGKHDAVPAEILPLIFDSVPAVLTFLVGNRDGTPEIRPISWEAFFLQFDLLDLSLAYDNCSSRFDLVRVGNEASAQIRPS